MSLRTRLTVALFGILALTLGGSFAVVYVAVQASELAQLDAALLAEALEEAREVAAIGGERLDIGNVAGPTVDDIGPLTKYAALYDRGGQVLDATESFAGRPPALHALGATRRKPFDLRLETGAGSTARLRAILVSVPGHDAAVLLGAPRVYMEQDSRYLWRMLVLLLVASLLSSMGLVTWVVRRMTQEHQRIASVIRRVAAGDLSRRVDIPSAAGETAQLAADVNEMIGRIDALLDSQRRFIAHASHEMRSPLAILYGELSHALRRPRTAEEYEKAVREAHDSARELAALTDDLLGLARLGASADREATIVSLRASTEAAVELARRGASGADVRISVTGPDAEVVGSPRDLERMIANLVSNAIRHSPAGGVVQVEIEAVDDRARVRVRDEGPGVAEDDREHVFQPFYRSSRAGSNEEGTGLGLAIVRETARAHGGDAWIEEASEGACFAVELPIAAPA